MIVAIALFEHLRNPKIFLSDIHGMLSDGGVCILEMPNKREPLIELYDIPEFKKFNYQKQHYYTYSEKPLTKIITASGFDIAEFYYVQAYSLDNHLSWLKFRKPKDYSRFTKILSKSTMQKYKEDLISNKSTDVIGVVFSKT